MKFIFDTHILIWASTGHRRLSPVARDAVVELQGVFSAVSMFEIAVKGRLGRRDFRIHPPEIRQELMLRDFQELPLTGVATFPS